MRNRAQHIIEMFQGRGYMNVASPERYSGVEMFNKTLHLPSGHYEIGIMYNPTVKGLNITFSKDGRTLLDQSVLRSPHEIDQARHDVMTIFSTISDIVAYIMATRKVKRLMFSGSTRDASKIKLYDRFADLIARKFGGTVESSILPDSDEKGYRIIFQGR
jgi:hypothetical protein